MRRRSVIEQYIYTEYIRSRYRIGNGNGIENGIKGIWRVEIQSQSIECRISIDGVVDA